MELVEDKDLVSGCFQEKSKVQFAVGLMNSLNYPSIFCLFFVGDCLVELVSN